MALKKKNSPQKDHSEKWLAQRATRQKHLQMMEKQVLKLRQHFDAESSGKISQKRRVDRMNEMKSARDWEALRYIYFMGQMPELYRTCAEKNWDCTLPSGNGLAVYLEQPGFPRKGWIDLTTKKKAEIQRWVSVTPHVVREVRALDLKHSDFLSWIATSMSLRKLAYKKQCVQAKAGRRARFVVDVDFSATGDELREGFMKMLVRLGYQLKTKGRHKAVSGKVTERASPETFFRALNARLQKDLGFLGDKDSAGKPIYAASTHEKKGGGRGTSLRRQAGENAMDLHRNGLLKRMKEFSPRRELVALKLSSRECRRVFGAMLKTLPDERVSSPCESSAD